MSVLTRTTNRAPTGRRLKKKQFWAILGSGRLRGVLEIQSELLGRMTEFMAMEVGEECTSLDWIAWE